MNKKKGESFQHIIYADTLRIDYGDYKYCKPKRRSRKNNYGT